jgi:hypothetical protein
MSAPEKLVAVGDVCLTGDNIACGTDCSTPADATARGRSHARTDDTAAQRLLAQRAATGRKTGNEYEGGKSFPIIHSFAPEYCLVV